MFARLHWHTKLYVIGSLVLIGALLIAGALLPSPRVTPRLVPATESQQQAAPRPLRQHDVKQQYPGSKVGDNAEDACIVLAPQTLQAYLSDPRTHVDEWFAPDADGLQIKSRNLLKQPLDSYTGMYMHGIDHTSAECSVWSGLESPWIITYTFSPRYGWLATRVQGPAVGAYDTTKGGQ